MNQPMTAHETASEADVQHAMNTAQAMRTQIRKAVIGQTTVVDQVLIAMFAGGHVLLEGVPGLGKTLLVRALAKTFSGKNGRIQFTPDLMPSDVIGHVMFDNQSNQFKIKRGPIFTQLLLADEINRAPAKTQASLLEGMQEQQVTLEGKPMKLPTPFMTLATQNPVEQEGTYPLPEAELDRFLIKVHIQYPQEQEESQMVHQVALGRIGDRLNTEAVDPVTDADGVLRMQQIAARIHVDPQVVDYAVRIVRATREWQGIALGAGPRGSLALIRCARAAALLEGRNFVIPDDIKAIAKPALRHRLTLSPDMEIEGQTADDLLHSILAQIEAPRI